MPTKKDIVLNNPLVFDIRKSMHKMVSQFQTPEDFTNWLKKNFGWEKYPYSGTHRYGDDSSTEVSDITYNMLKEGMELYWQKPMGFPKFMWVPIRIIHKYHNIVFFECLTDGNITYADCGADDYSWRKTHDKFEPSMPIHAFAPIEVLMPDYVDIESWKLPKVTKITRV